MNVNEGLSTAGGDQSAADAAWDAAEARINGAAPAEGADVEGVRREAPVTPHLDNAEAIKAQLMDGAPSTDVAASLTTSNPEEANARRAAAARVEVARAAAVNDPDLAALSAEEEARSLDLAELSERRREDELLEHLNALDNTIEGDMERVAAWEALNDDEKAQAIDLGLVDDIEEVQYLDQAAILYRMALQQSAARDQSQAAVQSEIDARTEALDAWANANGYNADQAIARAREVERFIAESGTNIAQLPTDQWSDLWNKADASLHEIARAEQEAALKNEILSESTSVSDGLEVLSGGRWVRPGAVEIAPRPDWSRVERATTARQESAEAIRASVTAESDIDRGMKDVRKIAGDMFARAARAHV
jgi:hypothetical protein